MTLLTAYVDEDYVDDDYVEDILETPVYTLAVEFVPGSFTNLSSLCLQGQVERQLSTLFEPAREGHAMFTLVNENGRFSPQNSASPYYPNIVPGKALKFEATYAGSAYPLFKGRITNYDINPMIGDRTVLIEADDDVNKLLNTIITTSLYVNTNAQSLFTTLMSASGVNSFAVDADIKDVIPFAWFKDMDGTEVMETLVSVGNSSFYNDGSGTSRLRSRHWKQGDTSVKTYAALTDIATSGFDQLDLTLTQESINNRIKINALPRKLRTSPGTIAWLDEQISIPASSGVGFFLSFLDTDDKALRAPALDVITPVQSIDWVLNTMSGQIDNPSGDKTSTGSLQFTVFGDTCQCSLFNGSGSPVFVTKFIVRGNSVQEQPQLSVEVANNSSQNLYGKREFTLENDLFSQQLYVSGYADYLLHVRKDPRPDVRFGLRNEFPDVLAREIGDVVSLVESLSAVNSQWQITELSHELSFNNGLEHATIYTVRQHPNFNWLILDHAVKGLLDSTNRLGF